jgi:hypothetical protein
LYAELVLKQMSTNVDEDIIKSTRRNVSSPASMNNLVDFPAIYPSNDKSQPDHDVSVTELQVVVDNGRQAPEDNQVTSSSNLSPQEIKEMNKKFRNKVWSLVFKHKLWFIVGLFGAAVFGAVFPLWGLTLAKAQRMFYFRESSRIRLYAANLAYIYISLGFVSIVSSTCEFWGVAQVAERMSAQLRSDLYEAFMRKDIAYFDDEEHDTGTLTTRLADDSRIGKFVCEADY